MSSETRGLALANVRITYGDTIAVDHISLELTRGEVLALLGPSGCGKSTLLRGIAGLEPLAAGTITWLGRDLSGVPVHRRGVGMMFQEHALFPHRNVSDNVGFGLRMAKQPASEIARRVEAILELVGLGGFGDRTVGTLSGGQAQRVALARALAPEPGLLLLDEPLGSLDRAMRDRLVREIRSIVTTLGITAIHVTHDHDEAISVADRIALMDAGRLVRTGGVDELLRTPGDVRTAVALGIDTVVCGEASAQGRLDTPFGSVAVDAPTGSAAAILLRPDAIHVVAEGDGVAGVVESSRYRGDAWLLTCRLTDGTEVVSQHGERLPETTPVHLTADLATATELVGSGLTSADPT